MAKRLSLVSALKCILLLVLVAITVKVFLGVNNSVEVSNNVSLKIQTLIGPPSPKPFSTPKANANLTASALSNNKVELGSELKNTLPANDALSSTNTFDLFLAVKTSQQLHDKRLPILLNTWIPLARQSTYLFTDDYDEVYESKFEPDHFINTKCGSSHSASDLACKVGHAYDTYIQNPRKWLCFLDDDTYVNVINLLALLNNYDYTKDWWLGKTSLNHPTRVIEEKENVSFWFATGGACYCLSKSVATKIAPHVMGGKFIQQAKKISLPDDVTMGYVINHLAGIDLTRIQTFHSHLELLWQLNPSTLADQITLSYGDAHYPVNLTISNLINTGLKIPTFEPTFDPTKLISLHCHMFPHAQECERLKSRGIVAKFPSIPNKNALHLQHLV